MFQAKQLNTLDGRLTVIINSTPYTVDRSHQNYNALLNAYHENDSDKFLENVNVKKAIEKYVKSGGLDVQDDDILFNGEVLSGTIIDRILDLKRQNLDIKYMVKFLENLMENPSMTARNQTFDFLEHRNMPITEDGCFMAYKAVSSDFWSKRGGKLTLLQGKVDSQGRIYNAVGEVIECERRDVDDNRDNECSYGLHVGALSYSGPNGNYYNHGDVTVIVKVNPKDVIAVPRDYDATKMRVCKYEVVSVYEKPLDDGVYGIERKEYNENYLSSDEILSHYDYDDDEEDSDEYNVNFPVGEWSELRLGDRVRLIDTSSILGDLSREVVVTSINGNSVTFDRNIVVYTQDMEDPYEVEILDL